MFQFIIRAKLLPTELHNKRSYLENELKFYICIKKYIEENFYSLNYIKHIIDLKNIIYGIKVELNEVY